ncbi:hypothetical protein [Zavarzinia sp.]|uniref:hypothetical protein n=1 Tax=Zavarzinia sp. TaxID=2027920 RepID=UPI00356ACD02
MNSTVSMIIGLVITVVCMIASYYIAVNKGRSPVLWVILAFFFSIITLIIIAVLPAKHTASRTAIPPAA